FHELWNETTLYSLRQFTTSSHFVLCVLIQKAHYCLCMCRFRQVGNYNIFHIITVIDCLTPGTGEFMEVLFFVPGFFWHKTSAGINVALAVIVRARILHEVAPERFVSLESH